MDWTKLTVKEFQNALKSSDPTPGGGTAAAIALGQAGALAIMVADLTLSSNKYEHGHEVSNKVKELCEDLIQESDRLAEADSDAFDAVVESFKLPKNTEEEKDFRRMKIRESTLGAAIVPFKTAELGLKLLELLPQLAKHGNPNAGSDVGVSSLLASAAVKGALFNVDINLNSLPEEMGSDLRERTPQILQSSRELSKQCMDEVRKVIS